MVAMLLSIYSDVNQFEGELNCLSNPSRILPHSEETAIALR